MIKIFYISAWVLLAAAVFATLLTGYVTPVALFVFSLVALGLIHALMLWSVVVNTRYSDLA
jgi:hypothetical protein